MASCFMRLHRMAGMADVLITEYTDPACPWAYSAEPFRQRLNWLYGDRIEWQVRMVVLSEDTAELEERGFGVKQLSGAYRAIARDHGMPIDTSERPRMAASRPACEAVVAARLHAPEPHARGAALAAGAQLRGRAAGRAGDDRGRGARRRASTPSARRSGWPATTCAPPSRRTRRSRGRRSRPRACSTTSSRTGPAGCATRARATRSSARATACGSRCPGFQPFAVYDTILANLVPGPRPPRAAGGRRGGAGVGGLPAGLQGGRGGGRPRGLGGARGARPRRDRAPCRRRRLLVAQAALSSIAICSRMSRPSWAPDSMPVPMIMSRISLAVDAGQHVQARARPSSRSSNVQVTSAGAAPRARPRRSRC